MVLGISPLQMLLPGMGIAKRLDWWTDLRVVRWRQTMKGYSLVLPMALLLLLWGCAPKPFQTAEPPEGQDRATQSPAPKAPDAAEAGKDALVADVLSVQVSGDPGAYSFAVKVKSPDTGCDRYADWWEVLGEDGRLIYRRVLLHSHVDEQPFTRSGGPVEIDAGTVVWVRAHMNPEGYGGAALKGSAENGFEQAELAANSAADVADQAPLPDSCAF
jgi:hypothetical protein